MMKTKLKDWNLVNYVTSILKLDFEIKHVLKFSSKNYYKVEPIKDKDHF